MHVNLASNQLGVCFLDLRRGRPSRGRGETGWSAWRVCEYQYFEVSSLGKYMVTKRSVGTLAYKQPLSSLESDSTEASACAGGIFEVDYHIRTHGNTSVAKQCSKLTHRRTSGSEPGLLGLRSHRCERQGLGFHRCQGSRGTYFESRPQTDSNKCIHNSTFLKYPSIFLHADYCGIPFYIFHL